MITLIRRSCYFQRRLCSKLAVSREEFTPVIGLEVHVQLATKTKLFSRAPVLDDGPPNSQVANFDMAEPGTLPKLNKSVVMHALRVATLLNCEVPSICRFDRKHYFYADMPAGYGLLKIKKALSEPICTASFGLNAASNTKSNGYQITQSIYPIAKSGHFGFHVYSENVDPYWKEVEILQLQIEQDSGKTVHVGNVSLIDLNRAGVPLVEVVTAPSFSTALEAVCFVQQLRLILVHYGICDGELHKGHMRIDANVSLSQNGKAGIKNMNSFRHLHLAVNYEIDRQYEILSKGGVVLNETRACDQKGRTVSMRDKEEETDYRFIPEPNLPTLRIHPKWIEECIDFVDQSHPKYKRFVKLGFDPRTAIYYAEDASLCNFVTNCSYEFNNVTTDSFIFWIRELKHIMQRSKAIFPPQSKFFALQFMKIVEYFQNNQLTKLGAIDLIRGYVNEELSHSVREILDVKKLYRITDTEEMDTIGRAVMQNNENLAQKARNNNAKAISRLRALIIEASSKRIDVEDAKACIIRLLSAEIHSKSD